MFLIADKTSVRDRPLTRVLVDRAARRVGWTALQAGVAASAAFVGTRVFLEDLGWDAALLAGELVWCGWAVARLTRGEAGICRRASMRFVVVTALLIAAGTSIGTLVGWGTVTSWFGAGAPVFGAVVAFALSCGSAGGPPPVAHGRRREDRRRARLGLVAGVALWPLLVAPIALGGCVVWRAAHVPARVARDPADLPLGPAPDLPRIDRALRRADAFIAGLYVSDGFRGGSGQRSHPVMSEYYGLPIRVRPLDEPGWRLLGQPGNSAREIARGATSETSVVSFDLKRGGDGADDPLADRQRTFELLADVDWNYRPGSYRVRLRLVSRLAPGPPVRVQIGETDVGVWDEADSGVEHVVVLPVAERRRLQSTRYTIRHATIGGYWWLRYHDDPRAAGMLDSVRTAGLDANRDLYSPLWWPDGPPDTRAVGERMVFSASLYRDCRRVLEPTSLHLQYRSKVCRVPLDAYRWLSFTDPEAEAAQALQIARQRGADAVYRDLDLRRRTPRGAAQRLERRIGDSDWIGLSRCYPLSCEGGWVTSTRTLLFGALEAELGYAAGDTVSRSYADLVARIALRVQVPDSGLATAWRARVYRPLQVGGFYAAWSAGWIGGRVPTRQSEAIDSVQSTLDMPREYEGFIASNAETTLAAYAFLVRYRCLRYAVGCTRATSPIRWTALHGHETATAERVDRFAALRAGRADAAGATRR
jgi:hypothetical protein